MSNFWLGYLISVGLYFVMELYGLVNGIKHGVFVIEIKGEDEEEHKWLAIEFYSGMFVTRLGCSLIWPLDVLTNAPKFARMVRDKFIPTINLKIGKDPDPTPPYEPLPEEALWEMRNATEAIVLKHDRKLVVRLFLHWAWMAFVSAEKDFSDYEKCVEIFEELAWRETEFVPDYWELKK